MLVYLEQMNSDSYALCHFNTSIYARKQYKDLSLIPNSLKSKTCTKQWILAVLFYK